MFNKTNFLLGFLMLFSVISVLCMSITGQEYFGVYDPKCLSIFMLSLILAFMFEGSTRETLKFTK